MFKVLALTGVIASTVDASVCPMGFTATPGGSSQETLQHGGGRRLPGYGEALAAIDFEAVAADIQSAITTEVDFWPMDYGHYGPFMIRLAWHCAGSYRQFDGRGGCDGGRIRLDPERSWEDNTNLNHARRILWPIKQKYGLGLSWGDLITLAGNVAIEDMGHPGLNFCAGRIDDTDGSWSLELGPSPEQELLYPCESDVDNITCDAPNGAIQMQLIYVNPEGPSGNPDPALSAIDIRDVFGRMGMDDRDTVALVGGGHAFGKTHGPCPDGPGDAPCVAGNEDDAWPGLCPDVDGITQVFTSGFEGAWTTSPMTWDNEYFSNLLNFEWNATMGPAGHWQWHTVEESPVAPMALDMTQTQDIMMLTADVALVFDDDYKKLVEEFAGDQSALDEAFANAWYKLTTRDMGPYARCTGATTNLAEPQPWQAPLPEPPSQLANFKDVRADVLAALTKSGSAAADQHNDKDYYGAQFVQLAWSCARTYRVTDYLGGCNGARIRNDPQINWPTNQGLDDVLALLTPIKDKYGDSLSYADLIVFAGQVALEEGFSGEVRTEQEFCPGRVDVIDENDQGSDFLQPPNNGQYPSVIAEWRETSTLMGLTAAERVALMAMPRSGVLQSAQGASSTNTYTADPVALSNEYYNILFNNEWVASGDSFVSSTDENIFITEEDLVILQNDDLRAIAQTYAENNEWFLDSFFEAWTKLVNADRWTGPLTNACYKAPVEPATGGTTTDAATTELIPDTHSEWLLSFALLIVGGLLGAAAFYFYQKRKNRNNLGMLDMDSQINGDSYYRVTGSIM